MPTPRDVLMAGLNARIAWFRRGSDVRAHDPDHAATAALRTRPRLHALALLPLSNRDHEDVVLRPLMWTLFDL